MKRGSETSGSAAATAGLKRSVCPTASSAPRRAAGRDQSVGLRDGRGDRLLHQHVRRRASRNGSATVDVRRRSAPRSSPRRRAPSRSRAVGKRRGAVLGGDLRAPAPRLVSTTPTSVDVRHRRQQPRVMLAEMADADDGDSRACASIAGGRRPSPDPPDDRDPGLVGRGDERASPSIISVLPASTDSADRAGRAHRLDRRDADDRHVEAHVLLRLRHLDDARRRGRRDARRGAITSSVPSIASTATTARSLTAIVWPMSRPAMASAIR